MGYLGCCRSMFLGFFGLCVGFFFKGMLLIVVPCKGNYSSTTD